MNNVHLKIADWYVLTKVNRTIIPIACLFLGALLVGNLTLFAVLPIMSILLIYASAASLNDIFDVEIDKVSNPDRPLPSHKLDVAGAYFIVLVIFLAGMLSTYFIGQYLNKPYFILIGLAAFMLGIIYCSRASKNFITANGILGMSHGFLPFITGVYLFGNISTHALGIGAVIYIVLFLTYNVKDFKDKEGDSGQRVTLPTTFTERTAKKIMLAIFFALLPMAVFSNVLFKLSQVHFWISVIASFALIWLGIMLFNGGGKHSEKVLNLYRYVIVIYILSFGL